MSPRRQAHQLKPAQRQEVREHRPRAVKSPNLDVHLHCTRYCTACNGLGGVFERVEDGLPELLG